MQLILIFLLSIFAAIGYGILHDQITARICVEYFTIFHAPVFHTDDPTLLGIGWGIIATWWVGAILGIPLALAARVGKLPKRSALSMVRPILILLACMAICAAGNGFLEYRAFLHHNIQPDPWITAQIPPEKQAAFYADWSAHAASYFVGFAGGIILIVWVLIRRYQAEVKRALAARSTDATASL